MGEQNNQYLHLRLIESEDLCNLFQREFGKLYSDKVSQNLAEIIVYGVVKNNWTPPQKPNIKDPMNLGSISLFSFRDELHSLITGRRGLEPQPQGWDSVDEIDNIKFIFEEKRLHISVSFCEDVFDNIIRLLDTDILYILWNDHPDAWGEV